ncbi:MAG: dynamin family protein [Clostridia bacterium]|nr:dynamin family protein [Clostridia bacterium]
MTHANFSQYLNDLQEKKLKLLSLAEQAAEYGWIPRVKESSAKDVISLEEIKEKLEKDTLTIGVIGQMKCGKSTFLNSFVFEDNILPSATTPMTAALSVITYGEKKRIVAEFYTVDEWAEQKQQASRSLADASGTLDESKIKAAKELVEKSNKLGSSLNSYLGKTQEDVFENLIEYVGADGKYISITKSVTIYYPKEYLKGVEVVDTPGFNDPIVSREERTKEFLKKADVVLMMLYAGRPFDATDRDIIFKNVRQCGIGKVLVGINKYDIPYCNEHNPEDEEQIKEYVKSELRKACRDCNDDTLVEILNDVEPIPLSAEMALLSEMPMSKIAGIDALDFAWKRHCSNFGIGTQQEMRKLSHLDDLAGAVTNLIDKEKSKILFTKPLNAIIAAGDKIKSANENELNLINSKIELLGKPDMEIDEKEDNLSKAHRRMQKKINSLGEDLDVEIQNLVRKGKNELEDIVDSSCSRMKHIIHNEWGMMKNFESIRPRLEAEMQNLFTRKLKRAAENLADEGKKKIKRNISEFFADAEDLLVRYFPEFDSRSFIKTTQNKIQMELESSDIFAYESESDEPDFGLGDFLFGVLNGASFGVLSLVTNAISHNDAVASVESDINSISNKFDPEPYLNQAFKSKDSVIEFVSTTFITNLIEPLQEQITEIRSIKSEKENELQKAVAKHTELEEKKNEISAQLENVNAIKMSIA